MSGKLLDTNIIVDLFRGDRQTIELLSQPFEYSVSVVTIGELQYGALLSQTPSTNTAQIKRFSNTVTVHQVDEETAILFGKIKAQLKNNGTPIPENDIWIAAIAIQNDLTILSNDKHFKYIDSLKLEEPVN